MRLLILGLLIGLSAVANQRSDVVSLNQIKPKTDLYADLPFTETQINPNSPEFKIGDVLEFKVKVPDEYIGKELFFIGGENIATSAADVDGVRFLSCINPSLEKPFYVCRVTSYQAKALEISSLVFKSGEQAVFKSEPKTVKFVSIGGDKTKDQPFDPIGVDRPLWLIIIIGLCAVSIMVALFFLLRKFIKKKKAKKEEEKKLQEVLTPFEQLAKECKSIQEFEYLKLNSFKPHYFGISEAAKKFIARTFLIDAEEMTTKEMVTSLLKEGVNESIVNSWKELFEEMDVTKFTDLIPEKIAASSLPSRVLELAKKSDYLGKKA